MKKPFEHYIAIIEDTLDYKLHNWQKEILRHLYNGDHTYYMPARSFDVTALEQAILVLCIAMDEEEKL